MKKFSTTSFLKVVLIFVFAIFLAVDADAQRKGKRKKKNAGDLNKFLSDLPTFFVNDNVMPKYLKKIYKTDATRLSIRIINKYQRLSKQTVKVPEELVQSIYNALVAIRVSDYGAIDDIAKKYYVRTYASPNIESIILVFEHDAEWVEPLRRRKDTTANPQINRLIKDHNLKMTKLVYIDEERAGLVLKSREPLNTNALSMKFYTEVGIGAIPEVLPYGDGNDINIERTKEGWTVVYSLRFGSCVSKCQKSHDWIFKIGDDGDVAYEGDSGHTIPPWIKSPRRAAKFPDVLNN
jgi:hypothetical protein